jgi:hypothetical protein
MQWDAQQVDSNGLFSVSAGDGNDWNLETSTGETTYNNALYVEALRSAAKLATAAGDSADSRQWSSAAASVKNAVNRILWNHKAGVYDASASLRGAVVQDGNVTAILAGIPSSQRARTILAALRRALATPYGPDAADANATGYIRDISPYMGSFNVLADFATGQSRAALSLIRQEWGYMVGHDPGGTVWERIEPNGVPAGTSGSLMLADSLAHSWSSGPAPALSEYVLGVAPTTSAYAHWTITPQTAGLKWAQGVVPTPKGPISVRWRRTVRAFVLTVQAPRGTSGTIELPLLGRRRLIARDGRLVRPAKAAGGYAVFRHVTGDHTYAWASPARHK